MKKYLPNCSQSLQTLYTARTFFSYLVCNNCCMIIWLSNPIIHVVHSFIAYLIIVSCMAVWVSTIFYRIAGNFRMVLVFVYFVCSIPYTKIKTAKIWNFYFFRTWPLTYRPTTATCSRYRQVLNGRLAHWTMSLYWFFAKALTWSDLPDPNGPTISIDYAITYNKIVSRPPSAYYFGTRILTYYCQFHRPYPLI